MRQKIFLIILLLVQGGFWGCGFLGEKEISRPAVVTLKTRQFALSDTAFIRQTGESVTVQLYTAGALAYEIYLGRTACVNDNCMDAQSFNALYLSSEYPPDLMGQVFRRERLRGLEGLTERLDGAGFVQQATVKGAYAITYRVTQNEVLFKDLDNHLIIRIKELP